MNMNFNTIAVQLQSRPYNDRAAYMILSSRRSMVIYLGYAKANANGTYFYLPEAPIVTAQELNELNMLIQGLNGNNKEEQIIDQYEF